MSDISNLDDVIDSRDVIERIEVLQSERDDYEHDSDGNRTSADWSADNPGDAADLAALKALAAEGEQYALDWEYGTTLIRESYFTDYCEELCRDIGDIPREMPGYLVIDWKATARNLRVDYTDIDFAGVTYLVR